MIEIDEEDLLSRMFGGLNYLHDRDQCDGFNNCPIIQQLYAQMMGWA